MIHSANHKKVQQAAQELSLASHHHKQTNQPLAFSICGGINIRIMIFNAGEASRLQATSIFNHNWILHNKSIIHCVSPVNQRFINHLSLSHDASLQIQDCLRAVPNASNGSSSLGAALIINNTSSAMIQGPNVYKKCYLTTPTHYSHPTMIQQLTPTTSHLILSYLPPIMMRTWI